MAARERSNSYCDTSALNERLYDKWSDDTVLPLINLHLVSYPTEETGKYTPLQLKFGTLDAKRFCIVAVFKSIRKHLMGLE